MKKALLREEQRDNLYAKLVEKLEQFGFSDEYLGKTSFAFNEDEQTSAALNISVFGFKRLLIVPCGDDAYAFRLYSNIEGVSHVDPFLYASKYGIKNGPATPQNPVTKAQLLEELEGFLKKGSEHRAEFNKGAKKRILQNVFLIAVAGTVAWGIAKNTTLSLGSKSGSDEPNHITDTAPAPD